MSFFNTFSDISKNQKNFRQWEQEKADEDVQRKAHFAQKPATEKELQEAKEFGRVVVDTVEFMDSQSEDKSESVETSVEMATSVASIGTLFASSFAMALRQAKKYREFSILTQGLNDKGYELTSSNYDYDRLGNRVGKELSAEKQQILEELTEHKIVRKYRDYKYLDKQKLLDQNTWKKLSKQTQEFFKDHVTDDVISKNKSLLRGQKMALLIPAVISFGVGAVGQLAATISQLKASKIARFQAREKLNDAKNFVEYTDEQKAEAAEKASEIRLPKEKKSGMIKDIFSLGKDYKKYEANSAQMDNIHLQDIQEDDPAKAYAQQKVINRVVQKINNQAEDYSENMETASQVILGSSVLGGAALGKVAKMIIAKIDRAKLKKDAEKGIAKEVEDDADMLAKEAEKGTKKLNFKKIGKGILATMRANPTMAGGLLSALIFAPLAMKLQKEASRAGRYKAKRDLEERPENFIYVEGEELSKTQATGIVKKEGVLDVLKSVPESIKAVFEYDKYKKTTLKDKKKFQEALKKTQVSDEQMKKAEALKTRLYKSFDVIDDRSEEYSEQVEAVAEVSKNGLQVAQIVATFAPLFIFAKAPHKFIKPATSIVAEVFSRFGGFAKKYTKGIGANIEKKILKKVEKSYTFERIGFAEKDINKALLTADDESFAKQLAELKTKFSEKLKSTYETDMYIDMIKKHRTPVSDEIAEKLLSGKITADEILPPKGQRKFDIKDLLKNLDPEGNKGEAISFSQDSANIAKWKKLLDGLTVKPAFYNADFKNMKDADIAKIIKNLETISQKIPQEELAESLIQAELVTMKNPARAMIMKHEKIDFGPADAFITKDIMPIVYGVGGVFVTGMVGTSYAIESYLSAKTKQAGRLGTMMAINDLDKENYAAKAKTEQK